MCKALKLDYAQFGFSTLFFQKLSKKNLEPPPPPPLGKERGDTMMWKGLSSFLIL